MSLKRRFINMARTELRDAARKVRNSADELFGDLHHARHTGASEPNPFDSGRYARADAKAEKNSVPERIRRYYANLELEPGASADEVKAAYRRLMRQYHPDKHAQDPKRARLANELSQRLRAAYDGLMEYLAQNR